MPYILIEREHSYSRSVKVDPFPCATHVPALLEKCIEETTSKFPIGAKVYWVNIPFELDCRTNAWASNDRIWGDDKEEAKEKEIFEGIVSFSGKRTIVHPAMTKYLVAHEYGHIVDYWCTAMINKTEKTDSDGVFRKRYAEMRGLDYNTGYGGGRWINNIGEIIADDFRIAVAGVDKDFYLHTCTHPLEHDGVKKFWKEMHKKFSIK